MKKNILKKCTAVGTAFGLSALALAQDTGAADTAFTTFMGDIKDSITDKVVEMLPILGAIAGVAIIIFLAMFVYRKVKAFMGR